MSKTRANRKRSASEGKISTFRKKCHDAGLRITPQRTAVYRALLETNEHPSAEQVFHKIRPMLPNISLDTVNRTLLTLSDMGAASIVEGSGDAKRFDGNLENHQHFKCVKCKRIIDFHHKPFDDIPIPKNIGKRFTVLRKTVYFEGLCDQCLSRLGRPATAGFAELKAKTGRKKKGSR